MPSNITSVYQSTQIRQHVKDKICKYCTINQSRFNQEATDRASLSIYDVIYSVWIVLESVSNLQDDTQISHGIVLSIIIYLLVTCTVRLS